MLLQKHALLFAESSIYTTNLYHDTAPICIAMLLRKYQGRGSLETPKLGFEQVSDELPCHISYPSGSSMSFLPICLLVFLLERTWDKRLFPIHPTHGCHRILRDLHCFSSLNLLWPGSDRN